MQLMFLIQLRGRVRTAMNSMAQESMLLMRLRHTEDCSSGLTMASIHGLDIDIEIDLKRSPTLMKGGEDGRIGVRLYIAQAAQEKWKQEHCIVHGRDSDRKSKEGRRA